MKGGGALAERVRAPVKQPNRALIQRVPYATAGYGNNGRGHLHPAESCVPWIAYPGDASNALSAE